MPSIFKKDTVIKSYPALDIVTREANSKGHINISANDSLVNGITTYTAASVVSYSLANNNDPIAAYNRAVALEHNTHWLGQDAICISNSATIKETAVQVDFDAIYMFEGKLFRIETSTNSNLSLVDA